MISNLEADKIKLEFEFNPIARTTVKNDLEWLSRNSNQYFSITFAVHTVDAFVKQIKESLIKFERIK
jgi:hypothetical protein